MKQVIFLIQIIAITFLLNLSAKSQVFEETSILPGALEHPRLETMYHRGLSENYNGASVGIINHLYRWGSTAIQWSNNLTLLSIQKNQHSYLQSKLTSGIQLILADNQFSRTPYDLSMSIGSYINLNNDDYGANNEIIFSNSLSVMTLIPPNEITVSIKGIVHYCKAVTPSIAIGVLFPF